MILGQKRGVFYRIYPNSRRFLDKIGGFTGKMRESGCLLSGAAARTGDFNKK